MLRWIRRKLTFCIVVVALFYYLNQAHPEWITAFGRWLGGEAGNSVRVAVAGMFDSFTEGSGLRDAVEVFREGLEG